jgi:hypothetical protein
VYCFIALENIEVKTVNRWQVTLNGNLSLIFCNWFIDNIFGALLFLIETPYNNKITFKWYVI